LSRLRLDLVRGRVLFALFLVVSAVTMYPVSLPITTPNAANVPFLKAVKALPPGTIYDRVVSTYAQLYDQTVDERPMVFGYVSRTPTSLDAQNAALSKAIDDHDYGRLCSLGLRYIAMPTRDPLTTSFPVVYKDTVAIVYDFKDSDKC